MTGGKAGYGEQFPFPWWEPGDRGTNDNTDLQRLDQNTNMTLPSCLVDSVLSHQQALCPPV